MVGLSLGSQTANFTIKKFMKNSSYEHFSLVQSSYSRPPESVAVIGIKFCDIVCMATVFHVYHQYLLKEREN